MRRFDGPERMRSRESRSRETRMAREHIQVLRKMLKSDRGVILPEAPNALAARVIADLGFCAIYLSGAGHRESCGDMGFSFVLYANAALQGMLLGMQTALRTLRERGVLIEQDGCIAPFAERQRLVGKAKFDEMERKYAHSSVA